MPDVIESYGEVHLVPDDRDRLTRLEVMVDTDRKATNDRFLLHHDRANKLQLDYFDYEKRLRLLENFALTAKVNWAWLLTVSSFVASIASTVIGLLIRKLFE